MNLGFDLSTQSFKALLINSAAGRIVGEESINFGRDLPRYGSPQGFISNSDPLVKEANPLMWVEALDLVLERLAAKFPLSEVEGVSGAAQQHGTVYLNESFDAALKDRRLLASSFSRKLSPIWMDRSTSTEVGELRERFGERLQRDTGSPAIERFAGPQIRRFFKLEPAAYGRTARIHLISSFICSLLCGKSAPLDYGDGAGMNLLNLKTLKWDDGIAEFTAPGLAGKLPEPVAGDAVAGGLCDYFSKYGLRPGIPVAVWSGDNPSSLIGMGAGRPGVAVISLGTSDTLFAAMSGFKTDPAGCGHVLGNPQGGFMALLCFSNGSLARERIKEWCGVDWSFLDNEVMATTHPGNGGRLMLPYFERRAHRWS